MGIREAKKRATAEVRRLRPLVESCQTWQALVAAFPEFLQDEEYPSSAKEWEVLYDLHHERDSRVVGIRGHVCGVCLAFRLTVGATWRAGGLRICASCRAALDVLTYPNQVEGYNGLTTVGVDHLDALAATLGQIPSREEVSQWHRKRRVSFERKFGSPPLESADFTNPDIFGRWTDVPTSVSCSPRHKRHHDGRVVFGFVLTVPEVIGGVGAVFEEVEFGTAIVVLTDFQSSAHDALLEVQRLMLAPDLARSPWVN